MKAPLIHRCRRGAAGGPLLVLLHGFGSHENDLFSLESAFGPDASVVSVRAPLTIRSGSYAWFPVEFTPEGPVIDELAAEQSRLALEEFVGWATQELEADPARVALAGFSQGGIMTASLALTEPGLVPTAVVMSGRILPEILPMAAETSELQKVRWLVVHGTQDQTLPIHHGRQARQTLRDLGVEPDYEEFAMGHTVSTASWDRVRSFVETGWRA